MSSLVATRPVAARAPLPARPSSRWLVTPVAALTLLAGILGSVRLDRRPMWYDEAFSVLFAQSDWAYFVEWSWAKELNALVYYLLLRGWIELFGLSEAALRSLSVLIVAATVPVVALIARRLFGNRAAVVAAALFATHGGMLQYAQETRTYALATLLVALAALCLVIGVQDRRLVGWLGFALISGIAVYAHLFAVFATAALVASLIALPRRQVHLGHAAAAMVLYGMFLVPSALFVTQAVTEQFDWVAAQMHDVFGRSLFFLAGNASSLVRNLTMSVAAILALSWIRRAAMRGRGTETWAQVLVASWAFVPLLLAFGASQVRPMLVPRYLIVAVPGIVLLVTAVLRLIWGRRTLTVATLVAVALQLMALPTQLYTNPQVNEAWRSLAQDISAQAEPTDGLIVVPAWQRVTLEYYLAMHPATRQNPDELPVPLSPSEPWGTRDSYGGMGHTVTLDELTEGGYRRLWVVLDGEPTRPERAEQLAALTGLELAQEQSYGVLTLRRYDRRIPPGRR